MTWKGKIEKDGKNKQTNKEKEREREQEEKRGDVQIVTLLLSPSHVSAFSLTLQLFLPPFLLPTFILTCFPPGWKSYK